MLLLRRCARSALRPAALRPAASAAHSRPGQLRASSTAQSTKWEDVRPVLGQGIPGPNDKKSRGVNQRNAESLGLVRLASVQLKGWLKHYMNDVCDDILRSAAQVSSCGSGLFIICRPKLALTGVGQPGDRAGV